MAPPRHGTLTRAMPSTHPFEPPPLLQLSPQCHVILGEPIDEESVDTYRRSVP